ncbi:MAG TPA: response regulator, partial [Candidatus Pelethocola excrementipullorum]|nr:response regulator [Candidatus Pelethocola excrementipullorum]
MIKVFLVEDEIIMRNGIKNNIPWEREGYEFVGDASDGELAYPLIKKTQPDILITDIRMPFMDGLELSALVKKEFPKIKIIILSGYGEFDYAKEAIRIGVTDYLLKPVSAKALLEAVAKVADQIHSEREEEAMMLKHMQEMEENAVLEKQRLFNDVVTNQIGFREMLERGEKLGLDFAASYYLVMLFKILPVGNPRDYSKVMVECQQKVEESIQQKNEVLLFDRGVEGWALIFLGETQEDTRERAASVEKI